MTNVRLRGKDTVAELRDAEAANRDIRGVEREPAQPVVVLGLRSSMTGMPS